jgi:hypothetical protein
MLQTDTVRSLGGKSVDRLEYLNRKVFTPLNPELLHVLKGKKSIKPSWNVPIRLMPMIFISRR